MGHVLDAIGDVLYVHTLLQLAASPDGFSGHSSPPGEWAWCFPLLSFIAGGGLLGSFFWCLLASLSKVDWFVDPSMPLYIPIVDWKSLEYLNYFFMKFKFPPKKIKLANWNSIHCYRQIHLGLFSRQKFNPHT